MQFTIYRYKNVRIEDLKKTYIYKNEVRFAIIKKEKLKRSWFFESQVLII